VSGSRVDGTLQEYEPVFATLSTMVSIGTTLVDGPRRRRREMLPGGVMVSEKGGPKFELGNAGTHLE